MQAVICPVCKGEGQICEWIDRNFTADTPILKPCHGCGGRGWIVIPSVIIAIPAKKKYTGVFPPLP